MTAETGLWMPLYWADYLADTTHLSTEEHGAYLLLIGTYWRRAKALPDDDRFLANVTKCSLKRWRYLRPKVSPFFLLADGLWTHQRVENEILKSTERLNSARANGRAGGLAKSYLTTTTSHKEISKDFLNAGLVGKNGLGKKNGNGHVTIQDPSERIARFQKSIAECIGPGGWETVAAATNLDDPGHEDALMICKTAAHALGKGWPRNWPLQHGVA